MSALTSRPHEDLRTRPGIERTLAVLGRGLGVASAWIAVADGEGVLRLTASWGRQPLGGEAPALLARTAIEAAAPVVLPALDDDPTLAGLVRAGFRSAAGVRLPLDEGVGALCVGDVEPREIDAAELSEVALLAARALSTAEEDEPPPYEAIAAARKRVHEALVGAFNLEEVLERVVQLVRACGRGRTAAILLPRGDELHLATPQVRGIDLRQRIDPEGGPAGLAASLGCAVTLPDLEHERRWPERVATAMAAGWRGAWYRPLLDREGRVLGVIVALVAEPEAPSGYVADVFAEAQQLAVVALSMHRDRVALDQLLRFSEALVCTIRGPDGWFESLNPEWEGVLARTRAELLARPMMDLVHPDDRSGVGKALEALASSASVVEFECRLRRSDGGWVWLRWTARVEDDPDLFHAVVRDITEERRMQDELAERVRRLTALRAVDAAITSSVDLRHVLSVLASRAREALGVDGCGVLSLDPATQVLTPIAGEGFRGGYVDAAGTAVILGAGVAGRAAVERKLVVADAFPGDRGALGRAAFHAREGFTWAAAVPLVSKGVVLGVLEVFSRLGAPRLQDWSGLLLSFASQAAIAIDNQNMLEHIQQGHLALRLSSNRLIEAFAGALDVRKGAPEGTSLEVARLTVRLARRLGVREDRLEDAYRGALLHDIGLLWIPEQVLQKPGALAPDELAVMRRHPEYARAMLEPVDELRSALDIPLAHHEWYDGTGYPRGLAGEAIPLEARIFAVVDVYHAMVARRPYREAWPVEQVRQHLRELAGTQLDPAVVEAFLDLDLTSRVG